MNLTEMQQSLASDLSYDLSRLGAERVTRWINNAILFMSNRYNFPCMQYSFEIPVVAGTDTYNINDIIGAIETNGRFKELIKQNAIYFIYNNSKYFITTYNKGQINGIVESDINNNLSGYPSSCHFWADSNGNDVIVFYPVPSEEITIYVDCFRILPKLSTVRAITENWFIINAESTVKAFALSEGYSWLYEEDRSAWWHSDMKNPHSGLNQFMALTKEIDRKKSVNIRKIMKLHKFNGK